MKKFLPTILIAIILVNLFAPFRLQVEDSKIEVRKNEVSADVISISGYPTATDKSITIKAEFNWPNNDLLKAREVRVTVKEKTTGKTIADGIEMETKKVIDQPKITRGEITIPGLTPETTYQISIVAQQVEASYGFPPIPKITILGTNNIEIKTLPLGTTGGAVGENFSAVGNIDEVLPSCGMGGLLNVGDGTIGGCLAQLLYYGLFIPTSYIFALTGQFFDWTFMYSISDDSYRIPFVVEGWGLVRDFVNMFFIFVLLYVAFATILNIHGFKTKEMIINVVIIGLLINFSLFATRVIIDASNILARVFYNSDAIKITNEGANGVANATPGVEEGPNGEIPLSVAIVNKVNPQNLIINGIKTKNLQVRDSVTGQTVNTAGKEDGNLGTGAFITITLLAVLVNIVGIVVFFSVGLVFVARVIGLWLAAIFVPFAFFSYTVPKMKSIEMVGWEHWWPETLKLAFLAPVFIFFLYLILKFLEKGLSLVNTGGQTGVSFVLSILIPFIFIMALLWKAKEIATKMSGTMGQTITGGIAFAGGALLGGAALGTAVLGRNVIGKGMGAISRTKEAREYGEHKLKFNKEVDDWKHKGSVGAKPTWDAYKTRENVKDPGLLGRLGGNLNAKQRQIHDVDKARTDWDALKEKNHLKGVDDKNLSGSDIHALEETFKKEKKSEIEDDLRKGKADTDLIDAKGNKVTGGESGYKAANRNAVSMQVASDPKALANKEIDKKGNLTEAGRKKVEDQLNVNFNAILKTSFDKEAEKRFEKLEHKSQEKVSGTDRVFAQSNKGSYDIRNASQTKTDKREGMFTKVSASLIAGIAMGVRTGLKTSGINHGSGQSDFLKDIGHTITEALKSTKINVKVEESHGKSPADSHEGGGHH